MALLQRQEPKRSPEGTPAGGGALALKPALSEPRFAWLYTPAATRLGVIALMVLFWEFGARIYNDADFLAPATQSFMSLFEILEDVEVAIAIGDMFWQLAVAFAMSLVSGLLLGMLVGLNRPTYRTFFPIILMAYAFPQITVLPVLVLLFGIGPAIKVVFGFTHGFFPIIVNVIAGTQNIDPALLTAARSMGASKRQIYRHIVFPHLVPSLFTGMRLGMTATLLGVILAELYATRKGIGYFTSLYSESFEPQNLFALVAMIAAAAICLNELLRRAEIRFGRWRE
ncbi:MAG: ABC transporter permease subunit [Rhodospirillales bacterium]|jgi:NitT/TauT family transport system permease protein|nr:ABC transporter permease subunit [Rhodospirillales bacterium]MDP6644763.1 ABC transporter permease subunit [Rhodospirillales bacterium]